MQPLYEINGNTIRFFYQEGMERINEGDMGYALLEWLGEEESHYAQSAPSVAVRNSRVLDELIIPEGVKELFHVDMGSMFFAYSKIKKITLPESLERIFPFCFTGSMIENIRLPKGFKDFLKDLIYIGKGVFEDCIHLQKVHINCAVKEIPPKCFKNCAALTQVYIPETVVAFSGKAFSGCVSIEKIFIPETLRHIGEYCFNDCKSLKKIFIPKNLQDISDTAFFGCRENMEIETEGEGVKNFIDSKYWETMHKNLLDRQKEAARAETEKLRAQDKLYREMIICNEAGQTGDAIKIFDEIIKTGFSKKKLWSLVIRKKKSIYDE
ncbi:MAG: leucine-rich repeat domain-containing protein [Defluviitaleaceae bacterium]|nr:leucine-rich repeat domain-containing protein [Defluviitaleaceae bacterium]